MLHARPDRPRARRTPRAARRTAPSACRACTRHARRSERLSAHGCSTRTAGSTRAALSRGNALRASSGASSRASSGVRLVGMRVPPEVEQLSEARTSSPETDRPGLWNTNVAKSLFVSEATVRRTSRTSFRSSASAIECRPSPWPMSPASFYRARPASASRVARSPLVPSFFGDRRRRAAVRWQAA